MIIKKQNLLSSIPIGLLGLLTVICYVASMPPYSVTGLAWVMFIPLLYLGLWLKKGYGWIAWATMALSWAILIYWLRHVTVTGWLLLSIILGGMQAVWFIGIQAYLKLILAFNAWKRMIVFCGCAGGWLIIEWIRAHFLSGFPWLPVAASASNQPVLLSILPYTGIAGLSAWIIWVNLALFSSCWIWFNRRYRTGRIWIAPELYILLASLMGFGFLFFKTSSSPSYEKPLGAIALVQPYTPADLKWSMSTVQQTYAVLERLTQEGALAGADVIAWPEAATPMPVMGDFYTQSWAEALSRQINKPIWMGNLAQKKPDQWDNGIFIVTPQDGLSSTYYSKRQLVPFGEYVPDWARLILPWLKRFVPLPGETQPGTSSQPLTIEYDGSFYQMGCLVCYEDIFSRLARRSAQAGADFFFVVTNNAWYGEEGAAEQHFAHSVLQAAQTRRMVLRVGNAGQSGWIDAQGRTREVLCQPNQNCYFQGMGIVHPQLDSRYLGQDTWFVQYGEWLTAILGIWAIFLMIVHYRSQKKAGQRNSCSQK